MARDHRKIEQVLQTCLTLIESGQETVESALARYPEFADQLRPELEIAIWLSAQKEQLDPRPGWVVASKRRVLARYQEEVDAAPAPVTRPGWIPLFAPWLNKKAVQVAFAFIMLLALFVGGNGIVMAAQDSLPGDSLYTIKTALEKVNLAMSLDKTKEAQLNLEYTQRRMVEFNRLLIEGRSADIPEALDNMESQVNQTIQSLDTAAGQNANQTKALAASLENILADQNEVLDSLIDMAPDSTKPAIEKAMTVSATGASATRELLSGLPSPTPTKSPANRRQVDGGAATATIKPLATSVPTKTFKPLATATSPAVVAPSRATPTTAPIFEPTEAPVATNTLLPPSTATNTPKPPTPVPPTLTNTPTATYTPTATDTPTPIPPTATNTATPIPPTATDTPTPITPTATWTPVPTDTPTPPSSAISSTPVPETVVATDPSIPAVVGVGDLSPTEESTPILLK